MAADGSGRNGAFTAALLKHLGTPGLPLEQMATQIVREVAESTAETAPDALAMLSPAFTYGTPRAVTVPPQSPKPTPADSTDCAILKRKACQKKKNKGVRHGDWVRRDPDGTWYILGRSDDTLNIAGKRIGPPEIEAAESILRRANTIKSSKERKVPHKLSKAKSSTFISESADGPAAYTELPSELPVHEAFEKLQALQSAAPGHDGGAGAGWLQALNDDELQELTYAAAAASFKPGEVLFAAGEQAMSVALLLAGSIIYAAWAHLPPKDKMPLTDVLVQ